MQPNTMTSPYPPSVIPTTAGFGPPASIGFQVSQPNIQYLNPYTTAPQPPQPVGGSYSPPQTTHIQSPYTSYALATSVQSPVTHGRSGGHEQPNYLPDNSLQRATSPSEGQDLEEYGMWDPSTGIWRCRYPGCSSKSVFTRACDLRKHYNRHNKYLFCRFDGCPQATDGGFSSKKDRARHEAKHNPQIPCEWEDCDRVFSRMDNMKDHVRRIHARGGSR